jgi:TetR/AcrR family transcriptional regulator, transcriptional repressor for nem operon
VDQAVQHLASQNWTVKSISDRLGVMKPVRPNTERTLTARGSATRARIIEAAADLILTSGVAGTSLDEVMAVSGASKSQLYHYFTGKEALIREVISLQTARVLVAQRPEIDSLDSMAALRRWRNAIVEANKARGFAGGCPLGSLANELAPQSESARRMLAHGFKVLAGPIEDGLKKMRERGELQPGANPEDLATAVLSAIEGGLLLSKTERASRPFELALDMALAYIQSHLAEKAPRP